MFSYGRSAAASDASGGKTRVTSSPLPLQTSPLAATLRTSTSGTRRDRAATRSDPRRPPGSPPASSRWRRCACRNANSAEDRIGVSGCQVLIAAVDHRRDRQAIADVVDAADMIDMEVREQRVVEPRDVHAVEVVGDPGAGRPTSRSAAARCRRSPAPSPAAPASTSSVVPSGKRRPAPRCRGRWRSDGSRACPASTAEGEITAGTEGTEQTGGTDQRRSHSSRFLIPNP